MPVSPGAGAASSNSQKPSATRRFFAEFSAPCGRSVLSIADEPNGDFQQVVVEGERDPIRLLRYHALVAGRFIVSGQLTGEVSDDGHCGAYPVLRVSSFAPWGPIRRITCSACLDSAMHYYVDDLPKNRFVAADFKDGTLPPSIDPDSCRSAATCKDGEVVVRDSGFDNNRCCSLDSP